VAFSVVDSAGVAVGVFWTTKASFASGRKLGHGHLVFNSASAQIEVVANDN
jgi:hypothetical protein